MRDWAKPGHHPAGKDLLLLPDRVFGFVFRSRRWACLQLRTGVDGEGDLQPVTAKSEGWDDLKLSGEHRNIIRSLMSSHFEKNGAADLEFDQSRTRAKAWSYYFMVHQVLAKLPLLNVLPNTTGNPCFPSPAATSAFRLEKWRTSCSQI